MEMQELALKINDHLSGAHDPDRWYALFAAALDATQDLDQSLELADELEREPASESNQSQEPVQEQEPNQESAQKAFRVNKKKESYFADCPRDELGHCKPSGQGDTAVAEREPGKKKKPPKKAPKKVDPVEAAKDYQANGVKAKAFKNWFGDWESAPESASKAVNRQGMPDQTRPYSKVVDEYGEPMLVYHGTTHDFTEFDLAHAHTENHLGKGFYFSGSDADADQNYAGEGPDLRSRIGTLQDRYEQELSNVLYDYARGEDVSRHDELANDLEQLPFVDDRMRQEILSDYDEGREPEANYYRTGLRQAAMRVLEGETPKVLKCYLNIRNPVVLDGNKGTQFYIEYPEIEEDGEMVPDFEHPTGSGVELIDAIRDVLADGKYTKEGMELRDDDITKIAGSVFEETGDDSISAEKVVRRLAESNAMYLTMEDEHDSYALGQFINDVFRKLGHDGVIYADASNWFPNMGIAEGTRHYIAFEPKQIKAADNLGTFDPDVADIYKVFKEQGHSYFEDCPRDDQGHCKPSGQGDATATQDKPGAQSDKPKPSQSASAGGKKVDTSKLKGEGTKENPFKCGDDIKTAAKLLAEGHHIQLKQPDQVATLLERFNKMVQKAVEKGKDAPNIDLCKISVPGTNLFCQDTLGIPRIKMPQMRGIPVPGSHAATLPASKKTGKVDLSKEFIDHLSKQGIKSELTKIRASHLRASQAEIVGSRVAQLINETNEGKRDLREKPIFVTRDNYICVDAKTEILSKRGWLSWNEVNVNDIVLTLNHLTGMSEWQPVLAVNVHEAKRRDLVLMEGKSHSSLTTPDHKWPVIYLRSGSGSNSVRRWRTSENMTVWDALILAADCASLPETPIYGDNIVELVAWAWTEGHVRSNGKNLHISQSHRVNQKHCTNIRTALNGVFGESVATLKTAITRQSNGQRLGFSYSDEPAWTESLHKNLGMSCFRMSVSASSQILEHLDEHKIVKADFITSLTKDQLCLFVQRCIDADGHRSKNGTNQFIQKSEASVKMFQMACALLGLRTCASWQNAHEFAWGTGAFYTTISQSHKPKTVRPIRRSHRTDAFRVKIISHDGIVWCPTTKNSSWLARRNGTVYYTGNCDGHHHWAAIVGYGYAKDKDMKIPAYKLDMDIGQALDMANEFTKEAGLAPKSGSTAPPAKKSIVKAAESYFSDCPRDDKGHCKPKGGGNHEESKKPGKKKPPTPKKMDVPPVLYHTFKDTFDPSRGIPEQGLFTIPPSEGYDPFDPNEYGNKVAAIELVDVPEDKIFVAGNQVDALGTLFGQDEVERIEELMDDDLRKAYQIADLEIAEALRKRGYWLIKYELSEQYGEEWAILDERAIKGTEIKMFRSIVLKAAGYNEFFWQKAIGTAGHIKVLQKELDKAELAFRRQLRTVLTAMGKQAIKAAATEPFNPEEAIPGRWEKELRKVIGGHLEQAALISAAIEWMMHQRHPTKDALDAYVRKGFLDVLKSMPKALIKTVQDNVAKLIGKLEVGKIVETIRGSVQKAVEKAMDQSIAPYDPTTGETPAQQAHRRNQEQQKRKRKAVAEVFSKDKIANKAEGIARTEGTGASGIGGQSSIEALESVGLINAKQWRTLYGSGDVDKRVRMAHKLVNFQTVGVDEKFLVGGERCNYPGDMVLSPSLRCGCRCLAIGVYEPGIELKGMLKRFFFKKRESYFSDCPRDDQGHCKPKGGRSENVDDERTYEKMPAYKGKMRAARRIGKGKEAQVLLASGEPAPAWITPAMVPPALKNVKIAIDPESEVLVTGINKRTGHHYIGYSDAFHARTAALKFDRVQEMLNKHDAIYNQNQNNRGNPDLVEMADCAWLMDVQATRPGGEADTKGLAEFYNQPMTPDMIVITRGKTNKKGKKAPDKVALKIDEHVIPIKDAGTASRLQSLLETGGDLHDTTYWLKSFGATTLEGRHVVIQGNAVRLQFVGKEGVWHDHEIKDHDLANMLINRKQKAEQGGGKLFLTDYHSVTEYVRSLDGGKFTPKDLRTKRANLIALAETAKPMKFESQEAYQAAVMKVAEKVSRVLGNKPAQALESYIAPTVFATWRASIG